MADKKKKQPAPSREMQIMHKVLDLLAEYGQQVKGKEEEANAKPSFTGRAVQKK